VHVPASGPVFAQIGRAGSEHVGGPSPAHATQVCVAGEQYGVAPPQSVSRRQPAQTPPDEVSHNGAEAGQREVSVAVHAAHAPDARQSGVAGAQSAAEAHARHVDVAVSQMGLPPTQAEVAPAAHWTQAPLAAHTGAVAGQSLALAQARHRWVVASQIGVLAEQSAASRQPTHVPAAVSHSGVAPVHAALFVAEHWPHAPVGSQAGVEPWQSVSPAQTRQRWAEVSQTGFVPPHWVSSRHPTHVPAVASQVAVGLTHAVAFVAEHWPHAPVGSQTGVAPPHWASAPQALQVFVAVSQNGFVLPHCALPSQVRQMPSATSQSFVGPVQAASFVVEQTPHAPEG
jgi:hypothetical protein